MRFLHFVNADRYQNSIEEDELHEVVHSFIEGRLIRQRLDIEVQLLVGVDDPAVEVDLEFVGLLAADCDEFVHENKSVSKDPFQHIVQWPGHEFEADEDHFDEGEHF